MQELRRKIRSVHAAFDDAKARYKEDLLELQGQCLHEKVSKWEYRLDTEGEVASNTEGMLYQYSECWSCGFVDRRLNTVNDYDSEIEF